MKFSAQTRTGLGVAALVTVTGLLGTPAQAHHSWAAFDLTTCKVVEGTVRTFEWNFPHTWLWVYVPNKKGGEDVWGFEGEPPSNLGEHGWTRASLKKGDKVKVKFSPLKDGRNGGGFSRIVLADGKVLLGPRGGKDICAKE